MDEYLLIAMAALEKEIEQYSYEIYICVCVCVFKMAVCVSIECWEGESLLLRRFSYRKTHEFGRY